MPAVALRSLRAHLLKLAAEGAAIEFEGRWSRRREASSEADAS
jgi:hypothetical protein